MTYPAAAGFRDIGSSTMKYNPVIYSGKMLKKFYKSTVLAAIANTDYEGEIKKMGDTVHIRGVPDMIIRDYKKGQTLVHQQPESSAVTLLVDQGKYWAFVTDDVDDAQTDLKQYVDKWTDDAAQQLKITIDSAVLAAVYVDAHASNQGASAGAESADYNMGVSGTPRELTKANILEVIVDAGSVLDEQNVPETGRFLVIPPRVAGLIKKSDLKDASLTGDGESAMRNGRMGMIDRFTLYVSNNVAKTTDGGKKCYNMLFGTKDGITFATQLTNNENLRNPFGFGWLYRGLQVYGYKVVHPKALGWLYGYCG